jgi:HSP20 family protein
MATLARRQREREPALMNRIDPFRTFRDLLQWSPFADMDLLPRTGDAMFMPDVELKETPDALVLKVDLPGMRENEIDIAVVGNRITISGRREEEQRRDDEQFYAYERQYGTFTRTFTLPETYDPDRVKAELKDGVLTVIVPKKPGAQARHIPLAAQVQGQGTAESQSSGSGRGAAQQSEGNGGKSKAA